MSRRRRTATTGSFQLECARGKLQSDPSLCVGEDVRQQDGIAAAGEVLMSRLV